MLGTTSTVTFFIFELSAIVHSLLIAGVAITVATFEIAGKQPDFFEGLGRT